MARMKIEIYYSRHSVLIEIVVGAGSVRCNTPVYVIHLRNVKSKSLLE